MYKILLVEDSDSDIEAFKDSVRLLNQSEKKFEWDIAKSYDEALELLKPDIDFAIIDIKLLGDKSGNDVIQEIKNNLRIPVAVMSGTPDIQDESIRFYTKGEKTYRDIISQLVMEIETGLFHIIGGRGYLEKTLNEIYWQNLYKNISNWDKMREDGINTEKVILRYTIAHLQELLDQEVEQYEPIEMYVQSQKLENKQFKTGEVLYNIDEKKYYIILSPACDLVLRNGNRPKVNSIILVEILDATTIFTEKTAIHTKSKKKKQIVEDLLKNNFSNNLYWLPESDLFSDFKGGFIDFRNIVPTSFDDLSSEGSKFKLKFKLQEQFVKNVLNQFSVYYGRQGQPDFNFSELAKNICQRLEN